MADVLTAAEADHIIEQVQLKVVDQVRWRNDGRQLKAEVDVVGSGLAARLIMNLHIAIPVPGKYTFHLRQVDGISIRRLDVRGSHRNPSHMGSGESWIFRTHKHRFRDGCADAFAYTPDDLPPTDSPPHIPEPGEHRAVYEAFCTECGLDPQDSWTDPPLPDQQGSV